ncbi:MAG: hypothetical protein LBM77_06270 [Spirochaetaceae bacterium]|jgi:hypothetical protein|nr:hypothetical protein [Spirochaetaceae bacterium]
MSKTELLINKVRIIPDTYLDEVSDFVDFIIQRAKENSDYLSATSSASVFGCLHRYANPLKIVGEKGFWEKSVVGNYAKN